MALKITSTPLQKIEDEITAKAGIELFLKRDDLMHPHVHGNKWRKLKYNIEEAARQKKDTLLTFGGAYSNHIAATAAAGKAFNFNTIGVIRGEETLPLNPILAFAQGQGMELHYISREDYRNKEESSFIEKLCKRFGDFYHIPEGGANALGVKGCMEIVQEIDIDFDYICCACGTGTTLAGIAASIDNHQEALGFSVLKGGEFLKKEVKKHLHDAGKEKACFEIITGYHFGGYARKTPELDSFTQSFQRQNNIPLDPVYTGKMMFGIYDLIREGYFKRESKIVALHTGGYYLGG